MKYVLTASALAALVLAGCQMRRSRRVPPPPADVGVVYFMGTPLSGPTPSPAGSAPLSLDPNGLVGVKVSLIALEKMPADALEPLSAHARLITAADGTEPILSMAKLTHQARYGQFAAAPADLPALSPAAAGRVRTLAELRGVVAPGITASFRLVDRQMVSDPLFPDPRRRNLCVDLYRAADGPAAIQVALSLEDMAPPPPAADPNRQMPGQPQRPSRRQLSAHQVLQRETALLDPPQGPHLVLIAPFAFSASKTAAVAVVIDIVPNTGEEYAQALEACKKDLANPAAITLAAAQTFDWSPPAIAAALKGLAGPSTRRASLVFLGDQTGAEILPDLALAADDAVLARLVQQLGTPSTIPDRQALGWRLDLAALELLRDMQSNPRFPRELNAVLLAHTGQAGRNASSMTEILSGLSGRDELHSRLAAENMQYLEDSSPAARIRAYDWLMARQKAPPGYDPLAAPRERREALEKAQNSAGTGGGQ